MLPDLWSRTQRFLGGIGVGFPSDFCPNPDVQLDHFLHHTPKLGIPVEMVQFLLKLILKQIYCCAPRFPLILTNFIPFMLRSRSRKFWKGRIFYLRLRNPACCLSSITASSNNPPQKYDVG